MIHSAFTGEKYTLAPGFDLQKAAKLVKSHAIPVLFYYGIINSDIDQNDAFVKKLFMDTCLHISANEQQRFCLDALFETFDQNKIEYMPLKGTLLKPLYPKPEMRYMGDADILIKEDKHKEISVLLEKLGYTFLSESNHEFIWNKKHSIHLELHKRLIPSYNEDYYAYFGDGWQLGKIKDGTRYSMTDEDQMIYLFTHFAKHYRDAGIGIRHIVDLWVYRNNKSLDEEYVKTELEKLQLLSFYENILSTIGVWFGSAENTPVTDVITNVIFNSGSYGTTQAAMASSGLKTAKKVGNVNKAQSASRRELYFPSYETMCLRYKVLKKAPVLLPFMWILRIADVLLFKRNKIAIKRNRVKEVSAEKITSYRKGLNFVGLDFNFGEDEKQD